MKHHLGSVRLLARLAACCVLLAAACGDDDMIQPPRPVAHVSLDLRVEPATASRGYVITATATNDGDVPVHWYACDCRVLTWVLGPDAQMVQVRRPFVCPANCEDELVAPGEVRRESYPFEGTVYMDGSPVEAPAGTYTVGARFVWGAGDGENLRQEQREQTFEWSAPTELR